jgi:hypothetical protein
MRKAITLAATVFALAMLTTTARADPIGTPGNPCGNDSCFGNVFTLSYIALTPTHYSIFLTVDTTGYTGNGTFLSDLAIKLVAQNSDYTVAPILVDAPGGAGSWTLQDGNLTAGGCGGSGNGWLCVNGGGSTTVTPLGGPGDIYTFEFDLTVGNASDWLLQTASVQARYGIRGNLTSEDITMQQCTSPENCVPTLQVPEPSSLALLGIAFLVVGAATRRRRESH